MPKEALDKFYAFLHTPIGEKQKLVDADYKLRE